MSQNAKKIPAIAALFLLVCLAVLPFARAASSLLEANDNLQSAKFRAGKLTTSHQNLSGELETLQDAQLRAENSITGQTGTPITNPDDGQAVLTRCASGSGATIDSLRPEAVNRRPASQENTNLAAELKVATFGMRIRGSESQIMDCLGLVTKVSPAVSIQSLDLSKPYGSSGPLSANMKIDILLISRSPS